MRRILPLVLFALGVSSIALGLTISCQQKPDDSNVTIDLAVEPSPPKVGPAKLTLDVRDADGKPIEGAALKLEGNMSHAGMKPVFSEAKEDKGGKYTADLEFTMSGDWFVLVNGKFADGKRFKTKIDVKGVKKKAD